MLYTINIYICTYGRPTVACSADRPSAKRPSRMARATTIVAQYESKEKKAQPRRRKSRNRRTVNTYIHKRTRRRAHRDRTRPNMRRTRYVLYGRAASASAVIVSQRRCSNHNRRRRHYHYHHHHRHQSDGSSCETGYLRLNKWLAKSGRARECCGAGNHDTQTTAAPPPSAAVRRGHGRVCDCFFRLTARQRH